MHMKGNFTKSFGLVETNAIEVISVVKCFNTSPVLVMMISLMIL